MACSPVTGLPDHSCVVKETRSVPFVEVDIGTTVCPGLVKGSPSAISIYTFHWLASVMKPKGHTSFELKVRELDYLKSEALAHLRRLNVLKLHYKDWFNRKHKTFVDALHILHVTAPQVTILDPTTIGNFRTGYESAKRLSNRGCSLEGRTSVVGEYLGFWDRLLELHRQGQCVHQKICDWRHVVVELNDPQLNRIVDQLQERLNKELNESFNFVNVRGTSSDLFTYSVGQYDSRLQRLVAFIPHLLQMSTHICFLCCKMSLVK